MTEGLVSVVVPIYNSEKYLERCVESIVNQTYKNLEILLIDDGSPDNCPYLCDGWASKDNRIKVIHKENQGLGMARNTGIDNATGEFICFFDGDDYILPETIEKSYLLSKKDGSQVVVFGLKTIDKCGNPIESFVPYDKPAFYSGKEVVKDFLPEYIAPDPLGDGTRKFYMSSCVSLYSTKLIEKSGWRFVSERDIISEDVYSLIDLYSYVESVSVLPEAFYCYCENESSLSHTYRADRYEKIKDFYVKTKALCEKKGYDGDIIHRVSKPYLANTIAVMKVESRISFSNLKKILRDDVLKEVLRANRKDKVSGTRKILFFLVRNKLFLLSFILLKIKA